MAELMANSGRCTYFFLYDGTKVQGEGDPTREGICYFYPEQTPVDQQELLCGQLAGVGRCVSELSSSPVRVLRLRHSKFAIKMEDDFFWALGCAMDFPTVSMCDRLDQLIKLFCFYNGPVRQSYQTNSRETLALCWSRYLFYLQAGATELHHIFSCLRTIDSTHIDPLLLLKAALILQACQRCPLVLAGCILFRGRVVSTQMPPCLTVRVMAHETQTYNKDERLNGMSSSFPLSSAVTSTTVHLTLSELQDLRSTTVDRESRPHSTPSQGSRPRRTRLSRTLSDTPSTESTPDLEPEPPGRPMRLDAPLSPGLSRGAEQRDATPTNDPLLSPASPRFPEISPLTNQKGPRRGGQEEEDEEDGPLEKSRYYSFHSPDGNTSQTEFQGEAPPPTDASPLGNPPPAGRRAPEREGYPEGRAASGGSGGDILPGAGVKDRTVVPMTLYQHRVKGLLLALLVEPHLQRDTEAMEEVYHSSLASLNGLEAHLRTVAPGAPGLQGPYTFAHYDCVQNTLTTNVSGRAGGDQDHSFVRATSLLHTHFCNSDALQEAIIRSARHRSARTAVYATRSVAQETYFLQHGGALRNSGVPNHQDTAFTLPSKARHRLLKHGVSLL
ncbi:BLOC-3 complex member HPS4 isoform X1 [Gadus morhua]|uniref:BLOC-3 complex member HPS4 isoform X1 n=1 Tax=Gadus morhua TaxID=8049 RepID=UPI0011B66A45|nr:Hermansky-Pudlak syndrome 4 protein isoform X1 [Gadus morhua]